MIIIIVIVNIILITDEDDHSPGHLPGETRLISAWLRSSLWDKYLDYMLHNMRQCQIRVRFESREMQFFKVLGMWFSMTKHLPIIVS